MSLFTPSYDFHAFHSQWGMLRHLEQFFLMLLTPVFDLLSSSNGRSFEEHRFACYFVSFGLMLLRRLLGCKSKPSLIYLFIYLFIYSRYVSCAVIFYLLPLLTFDLMSHRSIPIPASCLFAFGFVFWFVFVHLFVVFFVCSCTFFSPSFNIHFCKSCSALYPPFFASHFSTSTK